MTDLENNNDRDGIDENKKTSKNMLSGKGTYLALGVVFGYAIGVTINNIAIGVALGIVIGASIDAIPGKNKKKQ